MDATSVSIEQLDNATVVALPGEHDLASAPRVREVLSEAESHGRPIVVELTPTEFMDSSILRELVMAHGRLSSSGARLVLARPSAPVRRLFELTRATDLLVVADTLEAALEPPGA